MRNIEKIIVHCSATKASQDVGVSEIRDWHVNGNGWSDIGYHFVIKRDGTLENGRDIEEVGAHCKKHNSKSIGICLVGGMASNGGSEFNFLPEQLGPLRQLIIRLKLEYPEATLHGHNEFSKKDCPCFNVKEWYRS